MYLDLSVCIMQSSLPLFSALSSVYSPTFPTGFVLQVTRAGRGGLGMRLVFASGIFHALLEAKCELV